MTRAFQFGAYLIGLPLELMVIALLLRGEYKRYPFIFLYVVVDFLTTVIEIPSSLAYFSRTREASRFWAKMFWTNEQIIQVLVFLVVISLVYRATEHLRPRRTLLAGIICGTVLVAGISFLVHYYDSSLGPGPFRYMTPWTRDLNFAAAILSMGLWALLIGSRQKDRKLLLVTGALGIQLTGGAIGQALRDMSPAAVSSAILIAANEFTVITNLMRLYIWWQAFREKPKTLPPPVVTPSPK
jgi:hypothetical protein